MLKLLFKRLLSGLATLFAVSLIFFLLIEWAEGDFASIRVFHLLRDITPPNAEFLENYRNSVGLHRPAHERYLEWLGKIIKGEFGYSLGGEVEIAPLIQRRFTNTFLLALTTIVFSVPIAVGLGIYCAINRKSLIDRIVTTLSMTIHSIPEFLLGLILITVFAIKLSLFPSLALPPIEAGIPIRFYYLLLPALTLALALTATVLLPVRAIIISIMAQPFVEMAQLKGLKTWRIILFHILPHGIGPVANTIVLAIAGLLTGVIVTEIIFVYPGIGQLMVDAVRSRNIYIIQACGVIITAIYVLLILVADIIGILCNPRITDKHQINISS